MSLIDLSRNRSRNAFVNYIVDESEDCSTRQLFERHETSILERRD
jgi:hypothetical protein